MKFNFIEHNTVKRIAINYIVIINNTNSLENIK
jgi:hypothetical protein